MTALTYFTGKPCPKGHIGPRYVSNQRCVACCKVPRDSEQAFKHRDRAKLRRKKLRLKKAKEAGVALKDGAGSAGHVRGHERPPPEVIAEAVRAHRAPRNPFDDILGNPLPGRSALDQKRAEGLARFAAWSLPQREAAE